MRKYKKFIPQQVANHNRAASILQALQFQKVRINKYNDLTEGIYTGKITGTTHALAELLDKYVAAHDKHVAIYRFIADYYATLLSQMLNDTISHISGAPVENTIPFYSKKCA